ncbi:MAG: CDP-diacylglycerol--glycerol-3-phosphate 3-phosphatidyltransferase [Elusimicrobiota bacterium]
MKLSDKLTFLRIILAIPFVLFLLRESLIFKIISLVIFIIAVMTDYLDGKVARKRGEVSDLGKFLDPLADKIFIMSSLIIFVQLEKIRVPAWPVILIVAREFVVNGLRTFGATKGEVIAATMAGKIKTISQIIGVFLIILILIIERFESFAFYIVIIVCAITLYSGVRYMYNNRKLFKYQEGKT